MKCKLFDEGVCSSCQLLSLKNENPLEFKINQTLKTLEISHFDSITNSQDENYRNKAKWAVSGNLDSPLFGFFDRELSFHHLDFCPILMKGLSQMQESLKNVIRDFKLTPYDPKTNKGELKYILLFSDPKEEKFLLRFVLRSKEALSRLEKLPQKLDQYQLLKVKVISVNIQPKNAAIIEGDEEIVITKNKDLSFKINERTLFLGARSFYQVNHEVASKLYLKARTLLSSKTYQHILDLYCGVGGFSLHVEDLAKKVTGIEISKEAIETAKKAALKNSFSHLNFIAEDLSSVNLDHLSDVDVCILNPPRRGIDESTMEFLKKLKPRKIIYSSCNPVTLLKDQKLLSEFYQVRSTHTFDMFNLTSHLEVLCELDLVSAK